MMFLVVGVGVDAHAILVSQTHTTHTGMDGMGDNICTALPQHTITTLSFSTNIKCFSTHHMMEK